MGEIINPERTTYFIAHGPAATHTGITEPGQVTTTGQPSFNTTTEENAYLGALDTVATQFPPLPDAGEKLIAGEIYSWNGGGGSAWVDTGATVTSQAGQLFYVSADIAALGLTAGQAIRFGDSLETTYVQTWPGTTTLMQINPYVLAQVGMKVWKWA